MSQATSPVVEMTGITRDYDFYELLVPQILRDEKGTVACHLHTRAPASH